MSKVRIHSSTDYVPNAERDNQSFDKPIDLHWSSINRPLAFECRIFSERIPSVPIIEYEKSPTTITISITLNANG